VTQPPPPANAVGAGGRGVEEEHGGPSGAGAFPPPPPTDAGDTAAAAAIVRPGDGQPPPLTAALANEFCYDDDVCDQAVETMDAVVNLTRRVQKPDAPPRKKRKGRNGEDAPPVTEWDYPNVSAEVRQYYEDKHDWNDRTPLLAKRKGCCPGLFDSYRLRLVQQFALECGGSGLSLVDQEKLYDLLDTWDRTKPGQPVDAGHFLGIRDKFATKTSFKNALHDDIDDAIEDEGWLKCNLVEGGEAFQVIFRSVLEKSLARMKAAEQVKLWSGGDRPAPATNQREHPMDGDAFRLCEEAVIEENDENCFVLGMHGYSDASRVSSSGCKFAGWAHKEGGGGGGARGGRWPTLMHWLGGAMGLWILTSCTSSLSVRVLCVLCVSLLYVLQRNNSTPCEYGC